jgi:chemotaxis protein histidine kinase CheA
VDLSAFIEEFKSEALEHLERIDQGLLLLEQNPHNLQQVRSLFLSAHTIKGGAAMLSLTAIKEITHAFENILDDLREGTHTATPKTINVLLKTADVLHQVVTRVPQEPTEEERAWGKHLRLWPHIPDTDTHILPNTQLAEDLIKDLTEDLIKHPIPLEGIAFVANSPHSPTTQPKSDDLKSDDLKSDGLKSDGLNHVLLLEPSPTAQMWLGWQLERAGFTVTRCETLEQAQNSYVQHTFTLVVAAWEPRGVQPQDWLNTLHSMVLLTALVQPPFETPQTVAKGCWLEPELLHWLQNKGMTFIP